MADREKVLYALNCRAIDTPATCAECSYYNAEWCCCNTKYIMKDALALLKEQEAKVLTIDGIETLHKGSDVFIERRGLDFILPATVFRVGRNFIEFYGTPMSERFDRYNRFWRLWTNRPTDEQRRSVPWEPSKEE